MNEQVLEHIIALFTYLAKLKREDVQNITRLYVQSYLSNNYSKKITEKYLIFFDDTLNKFQRKRGFKAKKQESLIAVKILLVCEKLNKELQHKDKLQILLKLLELHKYIEDLYESKKTISNLISDIVFAISIMLNIPQYEYYDCKAFIIDRLDEASNKSNFIIIDGNTEGYEEYIHLYKKNISGKIVLLWVDAIKRFVVRIWGTDNLVLNGQQLMDERNYLFGKGDSIKSTKTEPIYYSDLSANYTKNKLQSDFKLQVIDLQFKYKTGKNGIKKFSFEADSGQLIGIMGSSGSGKSTLLNLLAGKYKPQSGNILINGNTVNLNNDKTKGLIGFVPQDDILFDELSVFENLYYNAKLNFRNQSKVKIEKIVNKTLDELDLVRIKYLKVGSLVQKILSGGERKRLNIALEIMREPSILLLDEPTSGLSSGDSENVMDLLKELSLKGKLIVVNIHQPSSDIYKLLDKLILLDKEGIPIYIGKPLKALEYLKTNLKQVSADENECHSCGNVNPEQIFRIINSKAVNEYGEFTGQRKMSPKHWYYLFRKKIHKKITPDIQQDLPENKYRKPNAWKQFVIFSKRNILSKISDTQFITISLLISPILALILGLLSKFISVSGDSAFIYSFQLNKNVPAFLFMSIVVALFVGMIVSAEEFNKDKRIRERERFLNLSIISYLNGKLLFLFVLSAIQSFLFVIVGNTILEFNGMTLYFWAILFSASCFSNLLGLLISVQFKSIVTIYIMVPILLIPQLLLSGVIIDFDKINYKYTSYEHVPLIADFMVSRWAYEAMTVTQYTKNEYQKHFFDIEQKQSNAYFNGSLLIPMLFDIINEINTDEVDDKQNHQLKSLSSGLTLLYNKKYDANNQSLKIIKNTLDSLQKVYHQKFQYYAKQKDEAYKGLALRCGNSEILKEIKTKHFNESLSDIVLNTNQFEPVININGTLIRKFEPIYQIPISNNGRAHFLPHSKKINSYLIDTFLFNFIFIWIMSFIIYALLILKLKPRFLKF